MEAVMMGSFNMGRAEVDALSDEDFIATAGQALFYRQRTFELLEQVVMNGVARAHGGKRRGKGKA